MGDPISAAVPALCAAVSAVELVDFLKPRPGASTTPAAPVPPLHSCGVPYLLLLASAGGLSTTVVFMYRRLHQGAAAVAAAGAGNRRLSEIVPFMLCVCAGVLQFFLFVRAPGCGVDDGPQARALGLAALSVLPAAATVTFFLGTMLIVAAHIRAGGEGGGGAIAIAGEEPIQAPVALGLRLLSEMALATAAGLLFLMAMAVYGTYYYDYY